MSITHKTRKRLWGLAAARCAFDGCKKELFEDNICTDDFTLIGEEAHIISGQTQGPRFSVAYREKNIDDYNNLILLCPIHHKIIDSNTNEFTAEVVRKIKAEHELWVTTSLKIDKAQLDDEEQYAEYIDTIENLAGFDVWDEWTSTLPGGHNSRIKVERYRNLVELHKYLCGRIYPKSKPTLEMEIRRFNRVLEDFINSLIYTTELRSEYLFTEKLYKTQGISIGRQYEIEYLIEELIYHLTKSANRLSDVIRQELIKGYRQKEGILLMQDAPIAGTAYLRLEYKFNQKYPGLRALQRTIDKRVRKFYRD